MAIVDLNLNAKEVREFFEKVSIPGIPTSFWRQGMLLTDGGRVQVVARRSITYQSLTPEDLFWNYSKGLVFVRSESDVMALSNTKLVPVITLLEQQRIGPKSIKTIDRIYGYNISTLQVARYETAFGSIVSFFYRGDGEYQVMLEHDIDMPLEESIRTIWKEMSN